MIRACREALQIRRSGLLQLQYYRSQFFKELGYDRYLLRLSPALHYVLFGARQNKNPNPFFDTESYRESNREELGSGTSPLAHYVQRGAREGKRPGPFFDPEYYAETNPTVRESGDNPLTHYLARGRADGRFPTSTAASVRSLPEPLQGADASTAAWLQEALGPPTAVGTPRPEDPDRFIRFEWDRGGWNNIRMQAEVMVCLARLYGRALVLPEPASWYLVPGEASHLFDFFDEAAFRAAVPVLPPQPASGDEWQVPARLGATNTVRLQRDAFRHQQHRRSWYFPRTARMFGCLAAVLGSSVEHYDLVRRAFRIRPDLLQTAAGMLRDNGLQPGRFIAAHVRRGDFQHQDIRHLSVDRVIASLRHHGADAAGSVLIVSDAYDEALVDGCRRQGWRVVCWAERQTVAPKLVGVLDMLCCCPAWRFVGTPLSTFSTGIMLWRGYVSRVRGAHVDAVPRFTVEVDQAPWWAMVDQHAWLTV